jgi:hypothetical protein
MAEPDAEDDDTTPVVLWQTAEAAD